MIEFELDKLWSADCGRIEEEVPLTAEFEWIWTIIIVPMLVVVLVVVVNFIFIVHIFVFAIVVVVIVVTHLTPSLFLSLYLLQSGSQTASQPLLLISPRAVKLYLTDGSVLQKIQSGHNTQHHSLSKRSKTSQGAVCVCKARVNPSSPVQNSNHNNIFATTKANKISPVV